MPVVVAAVCPHPPLLVPEIASGAAAELDPLRERCREALSGWEAAGAEQVVVVGGGPRSASWPDPRGDFGWYGVPGVRVGRMTARSGAPDPVVGAAPTGSEPPLSLLAAAWLLEDTAVDLPARHLTVAHDAVPGECLELGARIARDDAALGLLVMGDGSARRTDRAPGYLHPAAEAFDGAVADALDRADTDALRDLDADAADELLVAGRAAWQVLAGAARGRSWRSALLHHDAPYGVGYLVASWRAA